MVRVAKLLKFCAEKKKSSALELEVKELTLLLVESCSAREKCVFIKQGAKETVAAKSVPEKRILELAQKAESTATVHTQEL